MKLKETDIKYLAGIMDADGCLTRSPCGNYFQLTLAASTAIDRDGEYLKWLHENVGGKLYTVTFPDKPNWNNQQHWKVYDKKTLGMLLPRLLKHMVIKAKYWNDLWEGREADRRDVGPLKPKNHPSNAWLAGFLDGDGYYCMIKNRDPRWKQLSIRVTLHEDDVSCLEFLQKAFGGKISSVGDKPYKKWIRNLGPRDKSFAVPFLKRMHGHSRLKKHKIEQMLHYHSQRLSVDPSTEEAIVR